MKMLPGPATCELTGTIGHETYHRTRFGKIVSKKLTRYRIPSEDFLRNKALLGNLTYAWGVTLTAPQRTAWTAYSLHKPGSIKCGVPQFISGYTWFIKVNLPRLRAGLPIQLLPP